MRKITFAILFAGLASYCTATTPELKVMTYNLRVMTSADSLTRDWKIRKSDVATLILTNNPDIISTQEIANTEQLSDLEKLLPAYRIYAKGRDSNDGENGERLGILYKTNRFEEVQKGYFFLSEHPQIAGRGWDASYNRICVWVKLKDKLNGKELAVFDVHLDNDGTTARKESLRLISDSIQTLAKDLPVLLLGDFNANPAETSTFDSLKNILTDARSISKNKPKGNIGTFNGWASTTQTATIENRLDYLFVKNLPVVNYSVVTKKYSKYNYPSDHFPVVITCKYE